VKVVERLEKKSLVRDRGQSSVEEVNPEIQEIGIVAEYHGGGEGCEVFLPANVQAGCWRIRARPHANILTPIV